MRGRERERVRTYRVLRRDPALRYNCRGFNTDRTYTTRRESAEVDEVEVRCVSIVGTVHAHWRLRGPVFRANSGAMYTSQNTDHPYPVLECHSANGQRFEQKRNLLVLWVHALRDAYQPRTGVCGLLLLPLGGHSLSTVR